MEWATFAEDLLRGTTFNEKNKFLKIFLNSDISSSVELDDILSSNVISKLVKSITVPPDKYAQATKNDVEFIGVCMYARLICNALDKITHAFRNCESSPKKSFAKSLNEYIKLCAQMQHYINGWCDKDTEQRASNSLSQFLILHGYKDVSTALEEPNTHTFKDILDEILPNLTRKKWKDSCAAYSTFIFIMLAVKGDVLSDNLDALLPFTLILTDDFVERNIVIGIKCLKHILDEVPASEIRLRGRAEVIHDALKKKLFVKDARVARILIPCVLQSLQCLETDMMKKRGCRVPKHDECFELVLNNFHLISDVLVRRVYVDAIPQFMKRMGINCIGHMKTLMIVLEYGIESEDLHILRSCVLTINTLISVIWPRITTHVEKLIEFLVKALFQLENNVFTARNESLKKATIDCILETIAKISVVSNDLVMVVVEMMPNESSLNLKNHADQLKKLIDKIG